VQTCSKKRILVVDDENLIRWSLCMTLQGEDYEVHLAESAESAMDLTSDLNFDLIITDYRLEKEDGLAFTEKIKCNSPNTKVFILTAYGTEELRSKAQELGVDAFIDKPFDMSFLTDEVNRHLAASRSH
jgi:DNA-binding NtrC family response regulator